MSQQQTKKIVAVSTVPAHYQASIFKALALQPGIHFEAIFAHEGQNQQSWSARWNQEVVNRTGLLEGYPSTVLSHEKLKVNAAARLIRDKGPDAVLINSHRDPICNAALRSANKIGAKVILRSTPYDLNPRTLTDQLAREVFLRKAYSKIQAFCAIGSLARIHFEHYGAPPHRIFFSPYCTDEFFLKPIVTNRQSIRREFRSQHHIGPDETVLCICGRLSPEKRPDWTLRAVQEIQKEFRLRLLVVGNGPLASLVEEGKTTLGNDLIWLGYQQRQGVAAALAGSDILLLPSSVEPWGAVVNEAISFRLPTVASSSVAAAYDLVHHGQNGFVFPRSDYDAFVTSIRNCIRLCHQGIPDHVFGEIENRFSVHNACQGITNALLGETA